MSCNSKNIIQNDKKNSSFFNQTIIFDSIIIDTNYYNKIFILRENKTSTILIICHGSESEIKS